MRIGQYLKGNSYLGRFIAAGMTAQGNLVYAYAIMGRSPNSRNRIFQVFDGQVRTAAFDESKVSDPSLIIYPAVLKAVFDGKSYVIVANGDQSLDIRKAIEDGGDLADGISKRTFEPDGPNWTPRISMVTDGCSFTFGINRRTNDGLCERKTWKFDAKPGVAYIIHTYQSDGNPLPSFAGDPVAIEVENDFAPELWEALDPENRISLYVKEGEAESLFNAREMEAE